MDAVKDLFSKQAGTYAAYRPTYPAELYEFLFNLTPRHDAAWDCGTGNGQVAIQLAKKFEAVYATDISENQLRNATPADNIQYQHCRAEQTTFPDKTFDLITIGTALHWFHFDSFYKEVRRVAKPGAYIAAWTYVPFTSTPEITRVTDHFMNETLKGYWSEGRRYLDEKYKTIPFLFQEIKAPEFQISIDWTYDQFMGYVDSWSSVQEYKNRHQENPIKLIEEDIRAAWGDGITQRFIFPLYMRVGRIM